MRDKLFYDSAASFSHAILMHSDEQPEVSLQYSSLCPVCSWGDEELDA